MPTQPPLRRMHPDPTLQSRRYRPRLEFWRKHSTEAIVESLKRRPWDRDYQEFLKVREDGLVMQGNTRIKILQERGYNIDALLRYSAAD